MNKKYLLSFIVPVYNVEKYVEKCLNSLILEDFLDTYEIIIVNDGSTDGSGKICKSFAKKYKNITLVVQNNQGLSSARNSGIEKATGKYLMFIDSDDFVEQSEIRKIFDLLNEDYDVICFEHKEVDKNRNLLKSPDVYNDYDKVYGGIEFYENRIKIRSFPAAVCFNAYKRDFVIENSLYFKKGIYHEDEEWSPKVFIKAKKVCHKNIVFYNYLVDRSDSIMNSSKILKKITDLSNTYIELEKFFEENLNRNEHMYIFDYLARQYMNAFSLIKTKKEYKFYKNNFDKNFVKRNVYLKNTKIKWFIFRFNIYVYKFVKGLR